MIKVVLCGPPQSGKSCLREGLKQAIRQIKTAPYPYIITACPDGEGAWFSEAAKRDFDEAKLLKTAYKTQFTNEFAAVRSQWVKECTQPLTLVDVGGMIDDKNRLIMQYATHTVIIAGNIREIPRWHAFCQELNLSVIAILESDYHGECDRIDAETPILRGSIHYLHRGVDVSHRPMVQKLAQTLVKLSNSEISNSFSQSDG